MEPLTSEQPTNEKPKSMVNGLTEEEQKKLEEDRAIYSSIYLQAIEASRVSKNDTFRS